MTGVRITGMASGLPPNIVDQLMEVEKIPIKTIETKKNKQEDLLKLVNDLDGKVGEITKNLSELVSTRGFSDTKLISGDPNIVDGSVDSSIAPTGDYSIEVLQLAQKPGALTNGFPDRDKTQIGVGYIRFETPDGRKEVYINDSNSTLDGVAKQINAANANVRASVIQDRKDKENPFKLLVTGLATGDTKQVEFPTIYMLDGDQDVYFNDSRPAQNAKLKIDGFEIEVPENKIDDVIPGVSLDLKQAAPGREVRVFVKENHEVISGKIQKFVEAYNGALGFIQTQHKIQKGSNGRSALGPLGGESMLRSIENTLRRVIQTPQYGNESPITTVSELGIEFTRGGTLNFNQEKFNKTLNSNPKAVAAFFRGNGFETGFVATVKKAIGNATDSSFGPISNRKKGIQQKIDRMNKEIERKETQLEKKDQQLRQKFANLESKMSQIQGQGASVAAMVQQQKPAG